MCLLVWLLQNAWRAWGYTGTHMGCKLHVVASRPICGVRLWLIACQRDGEGEERGRREKEKKQVVLGVWVTPDTQSSQFVASRTVFCACMPRNTHTYREYFILGVLGWFVGSCLKLLDSPT